MSLGAREEHPAPPAQPDVVSPLPELGIDPPVKRLLTVVALACVVVTAGYLHLVIMRGTTFYVDEWNAIFEYGWSPRRLFQPVNGHNAFLGRTSWYLLMAAFGIADYLPFRVLGLSFNVFTALALFAYGYRRSGVLPGLALCTLSLFLGSSFHTILWPASAIGLFSMGALVLVLLCLERESRRAELGALALILLAFGSGGMGVVVYASATVEILLRRQLRRWWLVVLPPLAYLVWLALMGESRPQQGYALEDVGAALRYVFDALRFAVAGLFGRQPSSGTFVLIFYGVVVALLVAVNRRRIDFIRVASLMTAPLAFWTLTAVFRGALGEAGAPRYIAFGAIPLALVLFESARGLPSRRGLAMGTAAVAAVSVAGNLPMLLTAGRNFRHLGQVQRGQLAALEAVRSTVSPEYVPPGEWARYVRAGSYFSAVDRFGSPAIPLRALPTAVEGARTFADEVLVAGGQVVAEDLGAGYQCSGVVASPNVYAPAGMAVTIANRSASAAELRLRRFSPALAAQPFTTIPAGGVVRLRVRPDQMRSVRWEVTSSVPVTPC